MSMKEKRAHCPVCGGDSFQIPFKPSETFVECSACGLLFQRGDVRPDSLNRVYEEHNGDTSARRLLAEEEQRGDYYDNLFEAIVRRTNPAAGRVLEVGCGAGGLLRRFQRAGWKCEGIEPSSRLRTIAMEELESSTPLHPYRLEDVEGSLRFKPYDLMIGVDLIEHLAAPRLLPEKAFEWLEAGGRLFLQTPNAGALRRYLQREEWEQLAPEEHLFIHSRRSLRLLLEQSGFKEIEIRPVSGSTTDGPFRRALLKPVGGALGRLGLGNGLHATARKGKG